MSDLIVADKVIASCDGEQYKFEEWAKSEGFDMDEHPIHYLFMDRRTDAARQGWKAALYYVRKEARSTVVIKRRWGFRSKTQLPLFMVWEEYWHGGEVEHANIIFSTSNWVLWLPKSLRSRLAGRRY